MSNALAIHDVLLAQMPEGAVHDRTTCVACSIKPEGGKVPGDKESYTAED